MMKIIWILMDWSVGWIYCFKLFGNRKISKCSKFNSLPEWWMPKCKYWWPTFPNEGALGEFFTRGRITWIVDAKTHNLSTKQVWLPTLGQMIQIYLKCKIILLLKRVQMIFVTENDCGYMRQMYFDLKLAFNFYGGPFGWGEGNFEIWARLLFQTKPFFNLPWI